MVRWAGAGGAGVLTRALACLGHTRRGSGDARHPLASTRRADTDAGQPLSCVAQFVRNRDGRLTAGFQGDLTVKPSLLNVNDLHDLCSPMYQLQLLLRDHALIRNQH